MVCQLQTENVALKAKLQTENVALKASAKASGSAVLRSAVASGTVSTRGLQKAPDTAQNESGNQNKVVAAAEAEAEEARLQEAARAEAAEKLQLVVTRLENQVESLQEELATAKETQSVSSPHSTHNNHTSPQHTQPQQLTTLNHNNTHAQQYLQRLPAACQVLHVTTCTH